jgi:23S rRNA (uracil1939-C5)-methyltransferase
MTTEGRTIPAATRGSTIQVELTSLANGPYAVGHVDGLAVLARGGAPGDTVLASVTRAHARHLEAVVESVLVPGPARRIAPCPYYPECGGCSWQHLDYAAQLAAKAANVARELARLGVAPGALMAPVPAPAEWDYRRRIRLHVDRQGRLGFMRAASRRAIEIDRCLIAAPELSAAIPHVRRLVRALRTPVTAVDLTTRGDLAGVVLVLHAAAAPGHRDRAAAERFVAETPGVTGVVLVCGGAVRTIGETRVRMEAGAGRTVEVSPLAFLQVNAAANALLVAAVAGAVDPLPVDRALELHAGAGNFTVALAPRVAALHAVERDRFGALALARAARRIPGLTVERAPARAALGRLESAGTRFDWVLADPPRTGLRTELPGLLALRPPRIVYVSCDLATLVRDARALLAGGYALTRLELVDLFPQTHHMELVARFETTAE